MRRGRLVALEVRGTRRAELVVRNMLNDSSETKPTRVSHNSFSLMLVFKTKKIPVCLS